MTFKRSGASAPVWMLKESIISLVSLKRYPEATSRGNSTRTDSQLKKSWTVAPANALRFTESMTKPNFSEVSEKVLDQFLHYFYLKVFVHK